MNYVPVFIVILVCIISCDVTKYLSVSTPHDFPNKVGDSWIYQLVNGKDSYNVIKISIVGESKLPDGTDAKLWKYAYPNYTDTLWVTSSDKAAKFYDKPCFMVALRGLY